MLNTLSSLLSIVTIGLLLTFPLYGPEDYEFAPVTLVYGHDGCGSDVSQVSTSSSSAVLTGTIGYDAVSALHGFSANPPKEIVLHNSPGGIVGQALSMASSGYPIRVTGRYCSSACVMALLESPNACIEDSVKVITFHSVIRKRCLGNFQLRQVDVEETTRFVNLVKPPLRDLLGSLNKREIEITIPSKILLNVYPEKQC